ncbi:MAG: Hsp33 family molecular chaperone HslO [Gammaproteobacteria bacterium]|nr:Hsp33 family molecular chaperone HslO [Gammaproteobacteria bacterium]
MSEDRDQLRRFVFEELPMHGRLVNLNAAFKAVLSLHPYPAPVRDLLGQAMVAAVLLAATLKFRGQLTFQLEGDSDLKMLVVQCTDELSVRGLARYKTAPEGKSFREMVGKGRMLVTVEGAEAGSRYQGIVPLEGDSLADCLDSYFRTSEQLPTRFWLACDAGSAAGMLLQQLPQAAATRDEDAWPRLNMLAKTLTPEELLGLSDREILVRLFNQEDVRMFESRRITFSCLCTRDRVEDVLKMLGREEVDEVLSEKGEVEVHCEFCNKPYRFDGVDTARLFATGMGQGTYSVH